VSAFKNKHKYKRGTYNLNSNSNKGGTRKFFAVKDNFLPEATAAYKTFLRKATAVLVVGATTACKTTIDSSKWPRGYFSETSSYYIYFKHR